MTKKNTTDFETSIKKLEAIVEKLEEGDLDLDTSLKSFLLEQQVMVEQVILVQQKNMMVLVGRQELLILELVHLWHQQAL